MYASRLRILLLALASGVLLGGNAWAAGSKQRDPHREQAHRLQQANRTLEQAKAQLMREKTEAEEKLKAAEEQISIARGRAAGAGRRSEQLQKELDQVRAEKKALTGKLAETEKRLADTAGQLRAETVEHKRLEQLAAQQKQSIGQCESLNVKLHAEGVTLLEKYRAKSCSDAVLQAEPFTGLKQVEIENFLEDSRDKLDELRIDAQTRR